MRIKAITSTNGTPAIRCDVGERGIIEMHHDKLLCRGVSKSGIEFDAYPKGYTRDTKLTTAQDYTACRDAMCRMFDL